MGDMWEESLARKKVAEEYELSQDLRDLANILSTPHLSGRKLKQVRLPGSAIQWSAQNYKKVLF